MLDHAVYVFGQTVQNRYDERDKDGKRKRSLSSILGLGPTKRKLSVGGRMGVMGTEVVRE